jgi:hypothetical protein
VRVGLCVGDVLGLPAAEPVGAGVVVGFGVGLGVALVDVSPVGVADGGAIGVEVRAGAVEGLDRSVGSGANVEVGRGVSNGSPTGARAAGILPTAGDVAVGVGDAP